jgi:tetratricopeptide (TPR) repeat protein
VKRGAKSPTPLRIIALFVSLTEAVAGLALVNTSGGIQVALTAFVAVFPVLVAAAFFLTLWYRNYVFYPPSDFGDDTDVAKYVGAMRPQEYISTTVQLVQSTIAGSAAVAAAIVVDTPSTETTPQAKEENWWLVYRAKDYDRAFALLLRQAEIEKTDPDFTRAMAGRILLDKSKAEGMAYFETTFREMPTAPTPYIFLANAHLAWNQFDEALQVIDRGIAAGADFIELSEVRARYLKKMGRLEDAIAALKAASARAPVNPSPYIVGGSLFEEDKDFAPAEEWYRKALNLDPQNVNALASVGRITAAAGRKAEALQIYMRLVAIRPDDATYHTLLGNACLELNLPSKALAAYEKADELAKHEQGWIMANIGNLLTNHGFHAKAVHYLKQAVVIEPESVYAHERLARALGAAEEEDQKENELLEALKPKPVQVEASPSLLIRPQ